MEENLEVNMELNVNMFNDIKEYEEFNEEKMLYKIPKRIFDCIVSMICMIFLVPISIIIGILIKIEDGGKVFFIQERIGKDGKIFKMFKFRTMCKDADAKLEELLKNDEEARKEYSLNKKLKKDPRITKIGDFLRKTSLDELPQVYNVFKGDMSLVGPRPYLLREKEDMGAYYNCVIKSKPGITGYWQVSGRSDTTFNHRLELDYYYTKKKSLNFDFKILLGTFKVVILRKGSM